MFRHRLRVILLALGTFAGFAHGFSSLHHRAECRRAWMEEHPGRTCAPCPTSAAAPAAPGTEAPPPSEPR